ncbi:hypothetical protein Tco_1276044 [Tanacetum coccineum]
MDAPTVFISVDFPMESEGNTIQIGVDIIRLVPVTPTTFPTSTMMARLAEQEETIRSMQVELRVPREGAERAEMERATLRAIVRSLGAEKKWLSGRLKDEREFRMPRMDSTRWDWLVKNHVVIVWDEKIMRIPYGNEIPIVQGDKGAKEKKSKWCGIYLADALSRKSRPKPLRVRALVMTIGLNLPARILNAQVEARKEENYGTKDLLGMVKKPEPRADGTLYLKNRSWIPLFGDLRALIMHESYKSKYSILLVQTKNVPGFEAAIWWTNMKAEIAT